MDNLPYDPDRDIELVPVPQRRFGSAATTRCGSATVVGWRTPLGHDEQRDHADHAHADKEPESKRHALVAFWVLCAIVLVVHKLAPGPDDPMTGDVGSKFQADRDFLRIGLSSGCLGNLGGASTVCVERGPCVAALSKRGVNGSGIMRISQDLKWAIAREIPHLRRFARTLAADQDAADDLVQDCLERALRKRRQWARRGSLRSWLFRILYTTHLNLRSRQYREDRVLDYRAEPPPIPVAAAQDSVAAARDLVAGLESLPLDQKSAVLLVALEGLDYSEIADVMGVPIGTVRSRLWRARRALREFSPTVGEPARLRRVN